MDLAVLSGGEDHIPKQHAYDAGAEALLIATAAQAASETMNLYSSLLEVELIHHYHIIGSARFR